MDDIYFNCVIACKDSTAPSFAFILALKGTVHSILSLFTHPRVFSCVKHKGDIYVQAALCGQHSFSLYDHNLFVWEKTYCTYFEIYHCIYIHIQ